MWKLIFNLLIRFPTSYLVESGFSAVSHIMTKERNHLNIPYENRTKNSIFNIAASASGILLKFPYLNDFTSFTSVYPKY